ncbi:MAG: hypothetical protein J0653_08155 [Deltaproteobacteria bacterium]|nr:hypothetical protein [Deltaproteobacteria bacterium]
MQKAPAVAQILGVDHPSVQPLIRKESERIAALVLDKLPLLLDHFDIPRDSPDCWQRLAYRLARAYVPGLQTTPASTAGAPREWGPVELAALHDEVKVLVSQGMKEKEACHVLFKLPGSYKRFPRAQSSATIYRRYQEAKKSPLVVVMKSDPESPASIMLKGLIAEVMADDSIK